ncbi:hypothetical protein CDIK_4295 [Cucumispora dikerogammari]|nr:hypothetical protein CDIK_4295 [Cucumispora dikerogammari]
MSETEHVENKIIFDFENNKDSIKTNSDKTGADWKANTEESNCKSEQTEVVAEFGKTERKSGTSHKDDTDYEVCKANCECVLYKIEEICGAISKNEASRVGEEDIEIESRKNDIKNKDIKDVSKKSVTNDDFYGGCIKVSNKTASDISDSETHEIVTRLRDIKKFEIHGVKVSDKITQSDVDKENHSVDQASDVRIRDNIENQSHSEIGDKKKQIFFLGGIVTAATATILIIMFLSRQRY